MIRRNRTTSFPSRAPFGVTVNVFNHECVGEEMLSLDEALGSGAWTANLLIYVPLIPLYDMLVSQFFWFNGTVVDANTDVGIYSEDGATKLGSTGATLNSGTSQIQVVNVTDFYLSPLRRYWLALGSDSSTQTYWRASALARTLEFVGIKQQAAGWSSGLPTTATFAVPAGTDMPLYGFTGTTI